MAFDFEELRQLVDQAQSAVKNEKEVRKGLSRIESLLRNINAEVTHVYQLLDGATSAKKARKTRAPKAAAGADADAPYGRKADGTPKKRAGRIAKETATT